MATPEDTIVTDDSFNQEALLPPPKEESGEKNDPLQKSDDPASKEQVAHSAIQPADRVSTSSLLEVELAFLLGHQSYSLEEIKSFVEGKIIRLGGSDFQANILLQGKTIAQARLVTVEGVPSLQITKVGNDS